MISSAMRIGRPHSRLVSGGNLSVASRPILPPRPDFGRGEVEIVDRRVLDQRHVAHRVHAGRDRPHHVLPVARIDVVVHDDDEFRVHELAQKRPDPHHHALGVAGIGFADRHDGDAVGAALGRQPEIDDLRELLLQQRDEHLVQRLAEDRRLVRRPAGEGREIDRVAPHRDRREAEHREALDRVVVAGVVAIGAFVAIFVERDMAFEHDLGLGRHLQRHGLAIDELDLAAAQQAGELVFRQGVGNRRHRGEDRAGIGADHRRRRQRLGRARRASAGDAARRRDA